MTPQTTRILWWLAIGLLGFIYLHERHTEDSEQIAHRDTLVLPGFKPELVRMIDIIRTNEIIRVERRDHSWHLTEPVHYPAAAGVIEGFLNTIAGLKRYSTIQRIDIAVGSGELEPFGLDSPRATVVLRLNHRKEVLRVGSPALMSNRIYLQSAGHPEILLSDDVLLSQLPPSAEQWRDPALLQPQFGML